MASRLAVGLRAAVPTRVSSSREYRSCTSAWVHHRMNSQAASLLREAESITQPVTVAVTERSMAPSSRRVPGTGRMLHSPSISGANTDSWLYAVKSCTAIGISPERNRLENS